MAISYSYVSAYAQDDFYDINHVSEIRITFQESNWRYVLDSLFTNYGESGRLEGNINIDGQALKNVGVRYKGYSSFSSSEAKNPFNIELEYAINNQNHKGFTKLKLSNVIHDPTFIREVLSYEIARKYMPASLANFAMVYVNDTLLGLYTSVEAVDTKFISKYFPSHNNTFVKGSPEQLQYPFGQNANLAYTHGTDSSGYVSYYKLESDYGWSDLYNFINILNNDTAHIPNVLNVDRALWMHAFNYSVLNLDSYIGYSQNYYLYKDDFGRFNPILWDLNMSFGSFRNSDGTATNLTINKIKQLNPLQLLTTNSFTPRPLIKNLLLNTTYKKMFMAHIRTIINENFINNEYYTLGKQYQNIIDAYVQTDTNKFYSYTDFLNNIDTTTGSISDQYPGIRDLMEARMAYLDSFPGFHGAPVIALVQHTPTLPAKGNDVWITAKISGSSYAFLGYRQKSDDIFLKTRMYDDGNHNDGLAGDSIFGAKITVSGNAIQYYIYAENALAGIFSPERAEYEFYSIQPKINPGDIVINEFNLNWIELFNNTNEDYNLNDLYLSDNNAAITKWALPDTLLPSKTYLIVWTDASNTSSIVQSNLHVADFGGELYLAYVAADIIDSIRYGEVEPLKSIGRYPNGIGPYVYMQPTFNNINQIGTTQGMDLFIFPNPTRDVVYVEFQNDDAPYSIEIINTNGQTLSNNYYDKDSDTMSVTAKSIDISTFAKGIYVIKLIYKDYVLTKKLILF